MLLGLLFLRQGVLRSSVYIMRLPTRAIVLTLALTWYVPAAFADGQGWKLEQISSLYGPETSQLSSEGLTVDFKDMRTGIVANAPSWKILLKSDRTKKYCELTTSQYKQRHGSKRQNERMYYRKVGAGNIAGQTVDRYAGFRETLRTDGTWARSNQIRKEVWVSPSIKVPAPLGDYIEQMSGLSATAGFPLRIIHHTDEKVVTVLDTVTCRRELIRSAALLMPKGYKKVEDETDVMVETSAQEQDLEAIFGGFSSSELSPGVTTGKPGATSGKPGTARSKPGTARSKPESARSMQGTASGR